MAFSGRRACVATWMVTGLVALTLVAAGCGGKSGPTSVLVTFEIQLMNARADSYSVGVAGGEGTTGFGSVNEVIRESYYANVGQEVFAWVNGSQWDTNQPSHEVLCRILVNDEEIYMAGDQGTASEATLADCRGPVYIPATAEP
jgi:hypothetical protein